MLKTSNTESTKPKKSGVGVGGDSRAKRDGNKIDRSRINDVEVNGDKVGDDKVEKKS